MITSINIEQQIEEGLQTLLQADTYISTNSIDVRLWFDLTEEVVGRQVIVHANSAIPSIVDENGEAQEYEVKIDLLSYIHNTEDETPGTETNTLYQILTGFTAQTTKAQIQAQLTGLTVNGKNTSPFGEEYDERFYTKVASFTVYVEVLDPVYIVSGAGTTLYNGNYYLVGTQNGYDYYKHSSNAVYMFFYSGSWYLYSSLDLTPPNIPAYSSGSILGKWSVEDGTAPAPTVTAF